MHYRRYSPCCFSFLLPPWVTCRFHHFLPPEKPSSTNTTNHPPTLTTHQPPSLLSTSKFRRPLSCLQNIAFRLARFHHPCSTRLVLSQTTRSLACLPFFCPPNIDLLLAFCHVAPDCIGTGRRSHTRTLLLAPSCDWRGEL
ncbi:hypothetical protein M408DRAFT_212190 [Serendipita vermifera MAFF 305830]|uniref:Uncharacterized protein n=1 Tax=Serendipita vermifera MAFF 305830 TaxID=933852 RepID=A0A0C2X7R4_SERVB|nr:hypothetical protein M408DRAFT_212190 [Serendipita vermifera MAFF 305830]